MDIRLFKRCLKGEKIDDYALDVSDVFNMHREAVLVSDVNRVCESIHRAGSSTVLLAMPGCGKTSYCRSLNNIGVIDFDLNKSVYDYVADDEKSLRHITTIWSNILQNQLTLVTHPNIFLQGICENSSLLRDLIRNGTQILTFVPDKHSIELCIRRVFEREGDSDFFKTYKSNIKKWIKDTCKLIIDTHSIMEKVFAYDKVGFHIFPALISDPLGSDISSIYNRIVPDWRF